jgi:hypothetical protein
MAYGKIIVQGLVSENSDYSNPFIKTLSGAQTETPTSYYHQITTIGTTIPGYTLELSPQFTNIGTTQSIVIFNRDATNYFSMEWMSQLGTIANPGGAGVTFVSSAKTITDATSGSIFSGVDDADFIYSTNASNSANKNKTWAIDVKNSAHQLTVHSAVTDSAGDTTAAFKYGRNNSCRVYPGRSVVIPGDTMDRADAGIFEAYLLANTASVEVEIFVIGT